MSLFWRLRYKYKEAKRFIKDKAFLLKHGYIRSDVWNMDQWFMETMHSMLVYYWDHHACYPITLEDYEQTAEAREANKKAWDNVIQTMIVLLEKMNENSEVYEELRKSNDFSLIAETVIRAKTEFFELFSKHFYDLWD